MGKSVNKRELSELLGVSERSLTEWQRQGLPMEAAGVRGAENTYDTEHVVQWMVRRDVARAVRESPKDHYYRMRADREEIALAKDLELVAPVEEFERVWAAHIAAAKTELLNMSDVIASEISAIHGVKIDPDIVAVRVEAALKMLENFDVDDDPSDEPAPGGEDAPNGEGDA